MSKDTEPAQLKHKIYNWNNGRNYKKKQDIFTNCETS